MRPLTEREADIIQFILGLVFIIGTILVATCISPPVYACDEQFVQEPVWRQPDSVVVDADAGFAFVTYRFIDGTILEEMYQLAPEDLVDDRVAVMPHPLFYVITNREQTVLVYVDPEGYGQCSDIHRYVEGRPQ